MASTYSNLKIQLMTTGENSTTWGDVTNVNLGTALEEAIVGSDDVTFASANVTLTLSNTNASQTARNMRLRCTGTTGGSTRNLVVPSIEKPYIVQNDCADSIVIKTSAGAGITVPAGKTMWVYNNGTDVVDATTHLTSLTLGSALPVASGGTGGNTQATARSGIGATTVGSNLFTLTNPSAITFPRINADNSVSTLAAAAFRTAIGSTTLGDNLFIITNPSAVTFPRFNADNTVSALNAADFRTAIGAGTSSTTGTVTSVGGTGTVNGLTLTGTVTSSGNLTLGGTLSGVSLTTQVSGILPIGNGGTNATTESGARTNLGATTLGDNLFTITNPSAVTFPRFNANNTVSALNAADFRTAIGAGTSSTTGTVTSVAGAGTVNGLTLTGTVTSSGSLTLGGTLSDVSLTSAVTGTLPIGNGGTNATTAGDARTNLGATTLGGNMFTLANPSAVTFPRFNADNTVSALSAADFRTAIGAGAGSGTVTSVAMSVPSFLSVTGSPITSSGTLAVTLSGTALPVANGGTGTTTALTVGSVVFAGASGVYSQDNANLFWDDTNNRLGIGTATPTGTLGVSQGSTATAAVQVTSTSGFNPFIAFTDPLGTAGIAGGTSGTLLLRAGGSGTGDNKVFVLANGNVGIGAASPSERLVVSGTVSATSFTGAGTGLTGTASALSIGGNAATATSATTAGSATSAGSVTNAVTFTNTGGAGAGTTFNGSAARIVDYSTVGAPKADGTGASGTWGINISGNAATATSATTAGSATSATNATNAANLITTNFSIVESGGVLYFKYGTTNIAKLESNGAFTALNNVTGFGSI